MPTRSGSTVSLSLGVTAINTASNSAPAALVADRIFRLSRVAGTGTNGCDKIIVRGESVSSGFALSTSPTDLDLAGGSLDPITGAAITFTRLHGIYLQNLDSTQTIQLGGATNGVPIHGAVADYEVLPPGGCIFKEFGGDGIAVTASTGDLLRIVAAAGTPSCLLVVWGR
jgi:hypothetical protein